MGYPQQPHDPYGQQQPSQPGYGYGSGPQPQPGYGYQPAPSPPPRRSNTGLILSLAIGIPLLLLGGCAAVVLVFADAGRDTIVTEADSPDRLLPSNQPTAKQSQEQPKQEQPSTAAVGGAITLLGRDPALKMQVTLTRLIDPATGDQFSKPQSGNRLVAVEVTLANVGDAVYDDSPTNGALLIDGEGQQFRTTYATVQEGQGFAGGGATINTGDARKGVMVFEVPESAKLTKLQFALNSGFADHKGEWALS